MDEIELKVGQILRMRLRFRQPMQANCVDEGLVANLRKGFVFHLDIL